MRDMADPKTLGHGTSSDLRNVDAISAQRCHVSVHASIITRRKPWMELTKKVDENLCRRFELQEELLYAVQEVCLALYAGCIADDGIFILSSAVYLRHKRRRVAHCKGCV